MTRAPAPATAKKLAKLGIRSRRDLVLHLPLRYEDETRLTPPGQALPGTPVLIESPVRRVEVSYRGKRQLQVECEGVTLRFLHVHPDAPKATIVVISGGSGILGIRDDGSMTTVEGRCGPITRNRDAFAAAGFALALLDQSSTGGIGVPSDVAEVVRWLRARDAVPVWIAGGSSSTEAVAVNVSSLPASEPIGALFFSPALLPASLAAAVARPTFVLYHTGDPGQFGPALFAALTSAPIKERQPLSGGANSGCGYHLFQNLDTEVVTAVGGFIDRHNASLAPATPSTATAVEFYNATLDHYFLTHIANEIALLDAGTTIRG